MTTRRLRVRGAQACPGRTGNANCPRRSAWWEWSPPWIYSDDLGAARGYARSAVGSRRGLHILW